MKKSSGLFWWKKCRCAYRHPCRQVKKELAAASGIPEGEYSRTENGKAEPALSTSEKLAAVFEVSLSRFFNTPADTKETNLPLMEKVRLMDALPKEEKSALFKIIDLA